MKKQKSVTPEEALSIQQSAFSKMGSPYAESDAAMEADLTDHLWSLEEMMGLLEQREVGA